MPRNPKGKLKEEHKAFLVQRLAKHDTPKEAVDALRDEHDVSVSPQTAEYYDPTKRAGRNLSAKWRELFEKTRASFLTDIEAHTPEANKAVRVKQLAHAAKAFKGRGNYVGMADMLERIAKELGNVHTNKREVTGKEGGPIQFSDMTDEQLDARLAKLFTTIGEGSDDERGGD